MIHVVDREGEQSVSMPEITRPVKTGNNAKSHGMSVVFPIEGKAIFFSFLF